MEIVAVNHLPGLNGTVFVLPLLIIVLLAGFFAHYLTRFPGAAPPVEPDTLPDDTNAGSENRRSDGAAHYDRVVPVLIAVLFYLLCLWRLDYPAKQVFDEVHHVRSAMEFVWGQDPHEWTHPHFSKLLQAASMAIAGVSFDPSDKAWSPDAAFLPRATLAWRLPSVIFGSLALLGQYALARVLFKNRAVATLSMLFLALDGVFFVQSRIAMTNIFTVCFIIWATWAAWRWKEETQARHLFGVGVFLGLAIASRWSSLYAYALLVLFLIADGVSRWQKTKWSARFFAEHAALFVGFLLVVPVAVYAASYIPYMLQGASDPVQRLFSWNDGGHGWGKVVSQQGDMYNYHSQLKADHNYDSPAWSWPLMLRPVWYFFEQTGTGAEQTVRGIWCIGNAFIWWAILPVLSIGTWQATRQRNTALGLLCVMGLGQWGCWLAKARGLNFMHYLFEVIPFVAIGLAYFLVAIWRGGHTKEKTGALPREIIDTRSENTERYRVIVASYAGIVFLWFVFYYPMLAAYPIPTWYSGLHFWLRTIWI